MNDATCQRWNGRRDSYRPAGEPINPARFGVEPLLEADARRFVVQHHYSASYPAARARAGLYRSRGPFQAAELVGVAVFSVPMAQTVIPAWCPGLAPEHGVELGRFVLTDDVEGNGETWFLARALDVLAAELPNVRALVSFSDPMRRTAADGREIMPGHVGTIYQAGNGRYVGRSRPRWIWLDGRGRIVSERALAKLKADDRGAAYAYRDLLAAGAPLRSLGESGADYVARAMTSGAFRRVRHPGNLAYTWALGNRRERTATARSFLPALAFPKAANTITEGRAA